jgi:peptidoglycan/LPS O-acetylase OafA/YrhL
MRREEIKSLTGFRFLAAFFVFLFHVHTRWPLFEPGAIANIVSLGAVGMTMFFMLSGFILAYNYGHRDFSVRDFLWSRFARIYPIYAVAALLALPWLSVQLMNVEAEFGAISTLAQVITLLIAGLFMLQAWIPMMFGFWNNNAS